MAMLICSMMKTMVKIRITMASTRSNLKKSKGKPWSIPLHPKAMKALKKGKNELVIYIGKARSIQNDIQAELVGATAKGATK